MAWNPSPQIQVARDAAAKLGTIGHHGVDRIVILYTTPDGRCGYVSYGQTKALCDETRKVAESLYEDAKTLFADDGSEMFR